MQWISDEKTEPGTSSEKASGNPIFVNRELKLKKII